MKEEGRNDKEDELQRKTWAPKICWECVSTINN